MPATTTDRPANGQPPTSVAPPAERPAAALRASGAPSATVPPRTPAGQAAAARRRHRPTAADVRKSPARATAAIGGGVVAVVVVILLAAGVFSGGSSKRQPNHIGPAPAGAAPGAAAGTTKPVARGTVTVSVLNGTTVAGLARAAATKLQSSGFKIGQVTNAADNARSATIVAYAPHHQTEALDVARIIGVGPDAVQPIDQGTRLIAGPDAVVVVTVGADQSR